MSPIRDEDDRETGRAPTRHERAEAAARSEGGPEVTFHLVDERDFRERFLPGIATSARPDQDREAVDKEREALVREILDACDASGPSWTALHKLFDETRAGWLRLSELQDGDQAQRVLFAGYARVVTHLRPAFSVRGFGLSTLDRVAPDLARRVRSPGLLLRDGVKPDGAPLPFVPPGLPGRVPARAVPGGRSGGGFIPRDEVRPFLDAFRAALPQLVQSLGGTGEAGLTTLLSVLVEAKVQGYAVLEAVDALAGDTHVPKDHRLGFEKPGTLPPAVVREVGKLYGRRESAPAPAPAASEAPKSAGEVLTYSPKGNYEVGQRLQHKAFGTGEVTQVLDSRRLKVRFPDEERTLIQGLPGQQPSDGDRPPA